MSNTALQKSESLTRESASLPESFLRVFDRFYQVDNSHTREHGGSGIGLSLVKELVELHHGTIDVKSEMERGTEFTLRLPLGRKHLADDLIVTDDHTTTVRDPNLEMDLSTISPSPNTDDETESHSPKSRFDSKMLSPLPVILIVEDNSDVRFYLKEKSAKSIRPPKRGMEQEGNPTCRKGDASPISSLVIS